MRAKRLLVGMKIKTALAALLAACATGNNAEARSPQPAHETLPPLPASIALLDFTEAPLSDDFVLTPPRARPVLTIMLSRFTQDFPSQAISRAGNSGAGQTGESIPAAATKTFAQPHSPPVIPAWMRSGFAPLASPLNRNGVAALGACGAGQYVPSGLLKADGEERRRLLYPLVALHACRRGIPARLFDALLIQESGYNVHIRSPKGAYGLGQLMPGTAAQLGVDRFSIHGNLEGAARYLSAQLSEFGDPSLALAAYNSGPARVRKLQRVPRILETQHYVRTILRNWQTLEWRAGRQP